MTTSFVDWGNEGNEVTQRCLEVASTWIEDEDSPMPSPPPRELVAGRFEVQRRIGAGGMAQVFLARRVSATGTATTSEPGLSPGLSDFVVLKMILPALAKDTRVVELFLEEARLVSMLSHPNIVDVVGVGAEAGVPFIAMEYLHGQNLRRVAVMAKRRYGNIPLHIAIEIVSRAAAGLHYAHTRNDAVGRPLRIVHRDVTPHNIVFTYDGRIKLIDFGIAKASSQVREPTQVGEIRGKLRYLAPEQALSQPLDARTDVFALGVTLYELTTMQRAFPQSTEESVIIAVSRGELVKPSAHVEGYPSVLEEVVRRATASKPADRYQTAAELVAALDDVVTQLKHTRPTQEEMSTYVRELFKPEIERSMVGKLEGSRAGEPTAVRANPWARPPASAEKRSSLSDAATHIQTQGEPQGLSLGSASPGTSPGVPLAAYDASGMSSAEAREVTDPIVPLTASAAASASSDAAAAADTPGVPSVADDVEDDTALGWEWLGEDPRVSIPSADSNDVIALAGTTTAPTAPRPPSPGSPEVADARSRSFAVISIAAVAGLIVAAVAILAFGQSDGDDDVARARIAEPARKDTLTAKDAPPVNDVAANANADADAVADADVNANADDNANEDADADADADEDTNADAPSETPRVRPRGTTPTASPTTAPALPPSPPANSSPAASVAWLDAHCMTRVPCAAEIVARKKTIAMASLDEVRAFPDAVARCVRQCKQPR